MRQARRLLGTTLVLALVLATATAMAACSKGGGSGSGGGAQAAASLGAVPGDAMGVVILRSPRAFLDQLGRMGLIGRFDDGEMKALKDDLNKFFEQRLGVKFDAVSAITVFVTTEGKVGILLPGVKGKLKGKKAAERGDTALIALSEDREDFVGAQHGDVLMLGDPAAVGAAIDAASGKGDKLEKTRPKLAAQLKAEGGRAFLIAGGDPSAVPDEQIARGVKKFGLTQVVVSLSGSKIMASIDGEKDGLKQLAVIIEDGLKFAVAAMEEQSDQAIADDDADLATAGGSILGVHFMKHVAKLVKPKLDGDRLTIELPLVFDDGLMVVGLVGVASAVAIPAFMKYTKKSKTTEAVFGIKKLYDGARTSWYESQKFPPSAGPTPARGSCCDHPGGKCPPNPTLWAGETWSALRFSMDDPYQYSYTFESSATEFTVRAEGDLDCDGVYSTYEMVGKVGPDGEITGSAGIFKDRELE